MGVLSSRSAAPQLAVFNFEGELECLMQYQLLGVAQLGRLAACSKHMDSVVREAPYWETMFKEAAQWGKYAEVRASPQFDALLRHPSAAAGH